MVVTIGKLAKNTDKALNTIKAVDNTRDALKTIDKAEDAFSSTKRIAGSVDEIKDLVPNPNTMPALYDQDFAKFQKNPAEYFKPKRPGKVDFIADPNETIIKAEDYTTDTSRMLPEGMGNPDWILNKGYKPQSGERTFEGYVKNNVPIDKETKLFTKSSGFNTNPKNVDGQFKRFGVDGHGPQLPDVHVHQPTRNPAPNGIIYGGQGTKSLVDVNLPNRTDIKQLYEYLKNGKYHK